MLHSMGLQSRTRLKRLNNNNASRMQSCEFPATCQVRTVCACLDTCSSPYSSDTCGPMAASCKPSSPASLCRDSFSPSSESLGLSFSWQILVSASSGRSSPTQLELTSSLLSDKKKKKKKSHLALTMCQTLF